MSQGNSDLIRISVNGSLPFEISYSRFAAWLGETDPQFFEQIRLRVGPLICNGWPFSRLCLVLDASGVRVVRLERPS